MGSRDGVGSISGVGREGTSVIADETEVIDGMMVDVIEMIGVRVDVGKIGRGEGRGVGVLAAALQPSITTITKVLNHLNNLTIMVNHPYIITSKTSGYSICAHPNKFIP